MEGECSSEGNATFSELLCSRRCSSNLDWVLLDVGYPEGDPWLSPVGMIETEPDEKYRKENSKRER